MSGIVGSRLPAMTLLSVFGLVPFTAGSYAR